MQRLDGQLVLSPTDLTHHQECAHLTRLDLGVATGEWAALDQVVSAELQLVFDAGWSTSASTWSREGREQDGVLSPSRSGVRVP